MYNVLYSTFPVISLAFFEQVPYGRNRNHHVDTRLRLLSPKSLILAEMCQFCDKTGENWVYLLPQSMDSEGAFSCAIHNRTFVMCVSHMTFSTGARHITLTSMLFCQLALEINTSQRQLILSLPIFTPRVGQYVTKVRRKTEQACPPELMTMCLDYVRCT